MDYLYKSTSIIFYLFIVIKYMTTIKLFTNNFWDGFLNKTDANHIDFFLDLFKKVYKTNVIVTLNINDADVLLESVCGGGTKLFDKKWKHTYLYSGEHHLNNYAHQYDCVLWGEENHDKTINLPLYVMYTYCNNFKFDNIIIPTDIPTKDICCVISDVRGTTRNYFIEQLEKHFKIDHYGKYKNNMPKLTHRYNTKEFYDCISQYKFILTFEKFRCDTYITEKITHGFNAGIVPIYWGSLKIKDYFNINRFIEVTDIDNETIDKVIKKIKFLINNPQMYNMVRNQQIYKNGINRRTIDDVANDINLLLGDMT